MVLLSHFEVILANRFGFAQRDSTRMIDDCRGVVSTRTLDYARKFERIFHFKTSGDIVRGRSHWFESYTYGHIANIAISLLIEFSIREASRTWLKREDRLLVGFLRDRVSSSEPLTLAPANLPSRIIFIDEAVKVWANVEDRLEELLFLPEVIALLCSGMKSLKSRCRSFWNARLRICTTFSFVDV